MAKLGYPAFCFLFWLAYVSPLIAKNWWPRCTTGPIETAYAKSPLHQLVVGLIPNDIDTFSQFTLHPMGFTKLHQLFGWLNPHWMVDKQCIRTTQKHTYLSFMLSPQQILGNPYWFINHPPVFFHVATADPDASSRLFRRVAQVQQSLTFLRAQHELHRAASVAEGLDA